MSQQPPTLVWISSLTCFPGNNQCHDFSLMTTKLFWTSSLNCEASCQYPGYGVSNRATPNCCGHCDCVFHDWDIVMCPNTGHFAASEEKLLLPRCDGLIRYVKIGNRNWSSAGVGLGRVVQMKCSNQESVCWRNCSAGQHTPRLQRDQEGKHGRGLVLVSCWHVAICADRN